MTRLIGFPRGRYLGGMTDGGPGQRGNFLFAEDRIGLGTMAPNRVWVMVSGIESVTVTNDGTRKANAVIIVKLSRGDSAHFQIDGMTGAAVGAQMSPWCQARAIPLTI